MQIFLFCATQWYVGFHGRTGLNYPAVDTVIDRYKIEDGLDCLTRVRVIEHAALETWAEIRQRANHGA